MLLTVLSITVLQQFYCIFHLEYNYCIFQFCVIAVFSFTVLLLYYKLQYSNSFIVFSNTALLLYFHSGITILSITILQQFDHFQVLRYHCIFIYSVVTVLLITALQQLYCIFTQHIITVFSNTALLLYFHLQCYYCFFNYQSFLN